MQRVSKFRYYDFLQRLRGLVYNLRSDARASAENINPSIWHFLPLAENEKLLATTGGGPPGDPGGYLPTEAPRLRSFFCMFCNLVQSKTEYLLSCKYESGSV